MKRPEYVAGIVVDPRFGERLTQLAARLPVWIADTPTNREAAERYWQREQVPSGHAEPGAVTTFGVDPLLTPEEWCESILPDVDFHHGPYSHDPPCDAIEVVGARVTDALQRGLSALGFTAIELMDGGF